MKIRLVGTCVAILPSLLLCAPASSQTDPAAPAADQVLNSQIQTGDVLAGQTLNVESSDTGVVAATTAVGDSVSATGRQAGLSFTSTQDMQAHTTATTDLSVNGYTPYAVVSTSAVGNTGTAGTCCGPTTGVTSQHIGQDVSATTTANLPTTTGSVALSTSAVGNTQGWNAVNGSVNASSTQVHNASTLAESDSTIPGQVQGGASYAATAVSNNVSSDTSQSPVTLTVNQTMDGYATAASVTAEQSQGVDVSAVATATANNIEVSGTGYSSNLTSSQVNRDGVNADSTYVNDYAAGQVGVTSYGVANSALVSNAGPYTGMSTNQESYSSVNAVTTFNGGAGGDVYASATGVGNAVSGYACGTCQGTFAAANNQINGGAVTASTLITTQGVGGVVAGSASAIGNTATYQVSGSKH